MLVMTMPVAFATTAEDETAENGYYVPENEDTYRYYFYMPSHWYNEMADRAGVFFFKDIDESVTLQWPGYKANVGDVDGIYYVDCDKDEKNLIWNNYLYSEYSTSDPRFKYAHQTITIDCAGYSEDVSQTYPNGLSNFNNMIYIVDLTAFHIPPAGGTATLDGEWYYYYGNGEYGETPVKGDGLVYTTVTGDLDFSGELDVTDVTMFQKIIAGKTFITEKQALIVDANGDGVRNVSDVTTLQKSLAKVAG